MAGFVKRARWLVLLSLLPVLSGCSDRWGWYVVNPSTTSGFNNLSFLLTGFWYTILLSVTAIAISIILGLLVALPGLSPNPILRVLGGGNCAGTV